MCYDDKIRIKINEVILILKNNMFKTLGVIMCKYFYSMLVLVFISCSGTKPKMLLPEKVSPDVYEVLLENETVKVMKVSFAPGQEDNMHDHYPFTFHLLDGCLLYTSPSPRDRQKSRMPSSA